MRRLLILLAAIFVTLTLAAAAPTIPTVDVPTYDSALSSLNQLVI